MIEYLLRKNNLTSHKEGVVNFIDSVGRASLLQGVTLDAELKGLYDLGLLNGCQKIGGLLAVQPLLSPHCLV